MASWERLGEAQKYKATADANVNTRHVGATLRRISMDERIEERKTLKANQKKGAITMDLSDDEEDEEPLQRADSAVCGKSSPTANGDSNGVKATSMDSSTTASTSKNQENGATGVDDDVVIDVAVEIEDLGVEDDVVMEQPKGKAVEIDDLDIACVDEDDVAPGTKRPQRQISVGEDEPAPADDDLASGTKPPKPPERQITIASIAEDEPAPADADKHDAADEAAAEKAIPQCSKGHPLTEYRAHTAGTCDGSCGSKVVTGQHVMDCRPCNYWLCDKCSGCQVGSHNGVAKEVAATKTVPGAREVVHDLDALAPKKKRSRDSGSNKQKESGKDPQGEIPQGKSSTSVVEDLEAVSVVELDEADTSGGGAAARKARRRVQAARAKAAPAPKQVLLLE